MQQSNFYVFVCRIQWWPYQAMQQSAMQIFKVKHSKYAGDGAYIAKGMYVVKGKYIEYAKDSVYVAKGGYGKHTKLSWKHQHFQRLQKANLKTFVCVIPTCQPYMANMLPTL